MSNPDYPNRIEGYAIVSADDMIADRDGNMPDTLKNELDQRSFDRALDGVDLIVHGRNSHEMQKNSPQRRRLILTRQVAAIASDPTNDKARLWNPAGAPFETACKALGVNGGTIAVIGGTEVFGLFLDIGYNAFHLSRATQVRLPGGRPVFPQLGPERSAEDVLASRGLAAGRRRVLDPKAGVTLVSWKR
jgi:dihydrofolate reductase